MSVLARKEISYEGGAISGIDHKWLLKAAELEEPSAMSILGTCYLIGNGVEKDHRKAFEWIKKGAEQEHPHAIANLAVIYGHGIGVEKNAEKSASYFLASAKTGMTTSMMSIAGCYYTALELKRMGSSPWNGT